MIKIESLNILDKYQNYIQAEFKSRNKEKTKKLTSYDMLYSESSKKRKKIIKEKLTRRDPSSLPHILLDLDETLVSGVFKESEGQEVPESAKKFTISYGEGYLILRPGMKEFIDRLKDYYIIWVYSNGVKEYVQHIVENIINESKEIVPPERVRWREKNGGHSKNLENLFGNQGCKSSNLIIFDDRVDVYSESFEKLRKRNQILPGFIYSKIFFGFENYDFTKILRLKKTDFFFNFEGSVKLPSKSNHLFLEKDLEVKGGMADSQLRNMIKILLEISKEYQIRHQNYSNFFNMEKFSIFGIMKRKLRNLMPNQSYSLLIQNEHIKNSVIFILENYGNGEICEEKKGNVIILDQWDRNLMENLKKEPLKRVAKVKLQYVFDFFFFFKPVKVLDYLYNERLLPSLE